MRTAWTARLAVCGLVVATLALAPGSAASAAAEPEEPVTYAFGLAGSDGYEITFSASSAGGLFGTGPGEVIVRARRRGAVATYVAPAAVTSSSIRADLGPLGRLDLAVRPSGTTREVRVPCGGKRKEAFETGEVEGSIAFRGEGGFTAATASRARLVPPFRSYLWALPQFGAVGPCGGGFGESSGPGVRGARLKGVSYAGGRILEFQINKNRPRGRTIYRLRCGNDATESGSGAK